MITVMHKRTKIGCESLVQDAINSYPVSSIQIISTNSLKSFHSELKKMTSLSYGLINAIHKVINVDCKKRSEAKSASFDFCIKKISAYGVDIDILEKIQKFPFPFQQLIIREACAHIFHKHMYGNKLLTTDVWQIFCKIFEESGFEVYESQESFIKYVQTEQQKNAENQKIAVGELTERMYNRYWHVEEMGDVEKMQSFISMLEAL
ncbi:hypothetical protein RhiirC2_791118 [Rhizophagus irregularis]|uniref:Uncharacterized protein n=1 Tax=Rhizophagus irregularis TaxID=588596 RepID=A0A2N1M7C1_9GLOM|nr:hypothetical protein RhiirC2_797832 [Rhizophagus irregularis]PKK61928.1 hypothetical protein RhiirC2_791118 [Rhizophagus irregularis]